MDNFYHRFLHTDFCKNDFKIAITEQTECITEPAEPMPDCSSMVCIDSVNMYSGTGYKAGTIFLGKKEFACSCYYASVSHGCSSVNCDISNDVDIQTEYLKSEDIKIYSIYYQTSLYPNHPGLITIICQWKKNCLISLRNTRITK